MCEICGCSPCASQCPNAAEMRSGNICDNCGNAVPVGEWFLYGPMKYLCMECKDDMTEHELLEFFDVSERQAE